jgi:hypothetical protein
VTQTTIIFDCPVPPWLVGVAAALLMVALVVYMRRDASQLARRLRGLILAILILADLMLVGLALCPTLVRTTPDPSKPRCAILVDGSRSMRLDDAYPPDVTEWLTKNVAPAEAGGGKFNRESIAARIVSGGPEGWLAAVSKDFDIVGLRFSKTAESLALGEGAAPPAVDPEGYSTALGDVLDAATNGAGASRPRAVVLISDGAWNVGRDPAEVARHLQGTAVYVVGLGDPDPPRDAAILDLKGPKTTLLGDEVVLSARVATSGMGAVRLPVELMSGGKTLEKKTVATLPSGQPVTVNFTFMPSIPGRTVFEVRIPKQEGERNDANNTATLAVEIIERKINVLLIDSEPRWEFRFIRNVLERDPSATTTVCLLRPGVGALAGEKYMSELPKEKKDLAGFDLVVLGDVARDKMPDVFMTELADMVRRRGGALIVIAGRHENFRRLVGTPLAPVLPVKLDGAPAAVARMGDLFSPELTQDGLAHLVTRLADTTEENEAVWSHLPRIKWSASVGGLAPGATALLVHPYVLAGASKMPLLAVQRVGDGKVMFSGLDETWRWRRGVGDEVHYRFWAQAVRWMVKRQFTEGDPRARLSIDRLQCDVGETAQVEAFCLGPDGYPLQDATVSLKIVDGAGNVQRLALQPAPGGWGIYRAAFTPSAAGTYDMQPVVSAYGDQALASKVSLEVTRVDLEKDFLAQNVRALKDIAEKSGGQYLAPNQADQLPALLAAKKETRILTAEYSPCRHWAYYTILTVLLGAAWFIRKRSGLA